MKRNLIKSGLTKFDVRKNITGTYLIVLLVCITALIISCIIKNTAMFCVNFTCIIILFIIICKDILRNKYMKEKSKCKH